MPSALAFIGGGLLEGVGKGIVLEGAEKRRRAREALDRRHDLELEDRRQSGRRGLLRERLSAEDARQETADQRALERLELSLGSRERVAETVAKGAETRLNLNIRSREKIAAAKPSKPTDTTAAEDRIIERHIGLDENSFETVDHGAAADELESRGYKEAAQAQRRKAKAITDQDLQRRAETYADARIEEMAGTLSTDASDFAAYGGSRIKARAALIREFKAAESGTAPGGGDGTVVEVSGTPESRKQQLSDMPVGTKFRLDGKIYEKVEGGFREVGAR